MNYFNNKILYHLENITIHIFFSVKKVKFYYFKLNILAIVEYVIARSHNLQKKKFVIA